MKKTKIDKEDLYKNLDMTNLWINNSDTKASIVIAFLGFSLFELIKNTKYFNNVEMLLKKSTHNIIFSDCLYLLFLGGSYILILIGLYLLLKVLIPTLKSKGKIPKSLIYYGFISNIELKEYKQLIKQSTEEELMDDLINQNYINSKICFNKFNNFKYGTFFIILGSIINVVIVLLGLLIYK